jgi:hypothetical protein
LPSIISSIVFFQSFLGTSSVLDFAKNPQTISVMPNPASDFILVNWNEAATGVEFRIIDINGKIVSSGKSPSNNIDIHQLLPGMYTILVTAGEQIRIARFIHS